MTTIPTTYPSRGDYWFKHPQKSKQIRWNNTSPLTGEDMDEFHGNLVGCHSTSTVLVEEEEEENNQRKSNVESGDEKDNGSIFVDYIDIEQPADWVRGMPATIKWQVVHPMIRHTNLNLRIDVCNKAWDIPTTVAVDTDNTGKYEWKRVYWGMPIQNDYYIRIYATNPEGSCEWIAESETFSIVR